ncbi:MAG: phosphoglycerate mutase family protein [Anaerolineae bacterium]
MNHQQAHNRHLRFVVIVTSLLVAALAIYWYFCRPTEVLLVRHADRQGQSDALSAAGLVRAEELGHLLESSGIRAIYTSDAARTQQTALPVAELLGLTPVEMDASDVAGLVRVIRTRHAGQKVLVVGHSNTLPQIVAALGGPAITISSNDYDNLYTLTLHRCIAKRATLTVTVYGAPSP